MESRYHIIKDERELDRLIQACKTTGYASVDFETNAQPLYNKSFCPTILSVTFMSGSGCSIPLQHFEMSSKHPWKKWLLKFGRAVIENPEIVKIGYNWKFDNQIFVKYGIYAKGAVIDAMLAKYILNENRPNGLKAMVNRYLPQYSNYEKALEDDDGKSGIKWDQIPLEELCKYGCLDTDMTFRLGIFFEKKLIDLDMYYIFRNLYMPMSRVLQETEANGLYLDREFNDKLLAEYKPKIDAALEAIYNLPKMQKLQREYVKSRVEAYLDKVQAEIDELDPNDPKDARKIKSREQKIARVQAGEYGNKEERELVRKINLGSPKDLPWIMYEAERGFKFPILKYSDAGKPSTDEETLTNLRLEIKDPESPKAIFLDRLLDYRALTKMYTTYIEGWHDKVQDDNKLHGRYLIHGTTSGRLSSQEPNMQQIPKTSVDPNIKRQLVAAPGTLYFVMDYSQAELRIMAHLSQDETYLRAFREGQDPHLAIAAQKYDTPYEEAEKIYSNEEHPDYKLWKTRRKQAKQIVFGLIYGIQAKLLSVKLSDPKAGLIVTPQEAQRMQDEFFDEHPKIKKYMKKQEKILKKQGYITSLFGTKRRLPEVYSDDNAEAAYAIRLAVNFPCQCAASHMTQFGCILNYWEMKQGNYPPMKEVATVHDALYYNIDPKYINTYTVWKIWDTLRDPQTKKYFGFQIDDVQMDMDVTIGRTMAEELPFIPGYDYNKLLQPDFDVDAYMEEHKKYKGISTGDYPKLYPESFEKGKQWKKLK